MLDVVCYLVSVYVTILYLWVRKTTWGRLYKVISSALWRKKLRIPPLHLRDWVLGPYNKSFTKLDFPLAFLWSSNSC